jgi:hypothetical protein
MTPPLFVKCRSLTTVSATLTNSALAFALLNPGMISDFDNAEGGSETRQRLPVRFVHAPRVKLTLEDRPPVATVPVVARVLWLRKEILPKVRYTSGVQSSPLR